MNLAYVIAALATCLIKSVVSVVDYGTQVEVSTEYTHVQAKIRDGVVKSRGVNLGGWLVAEHWMTTNAAFWQDVDITDANSGEYTTITKSTNPDITRSKIGDHHATFITESDIQQIAAVGLNTVRVPVGFWIIGYDNHDPSNQGEWKVYTRGTIVHLDNLIRNWAKKYNVAVLVDLHAAKGSQNGHDNSSPANPGQTYWSQYPENVANSIEVARFLADRYLHDEAFLGVGLLNEPNGSTNEAVLYQYYKDAYHAVRSTGSDCVLTVMPMLLEQTPNEMVGFMTLPDYYNVLVEWHPYFRWGYESLSDEQLVEVAVKRDYQESVTEWNNRSIHKRLYIGEWSLGTASNMHQNNLDLFYTFAMEQLKVHDQAEGGWTFWSWKAIGDANDNVDGWGLQDLLTDNRIADIFRQNA